MRNLKKILALVLALVMSLSLMATAGAADASAASTDKYATAKEVLEGLEVFRGDEGGMRYDSSITRAETAALVYRIATADVKDTQRDLYTKHPFTDLAPVEGWARGYIAYGYNAEILKGNGDNTFTPNDPVTGYATLAMILRTMGYGKNGEFEGVNWEIQTAATAKREGLLNGVTAADEAALGQPAPRGLVAQILFNALLQPTVELDVRMPNLYPKDAETLGYQKFRLEEVEGIVTGNEFADLYSEQVLAVGYTNLETKDGNKVLARTTEITDVGERHLAYITGTKVLSITKEGLNKVTETGAATDISTTSKFNAVTEMTKADDIEYYVNFDRSGYWTSDYRVEYELYLGSVSDEYRAEYVDNNGGEFTASTDDGWTYHKLIPANKEITDEDYTNIRYIFTWSNGKTNADDKTTLFAYEGKVFVGTQTGKDISDEISFTNFVATYLNEKKFNDNWNWSYNGQWVKFIDNDLDGKVDYALKTNSWLDEVLETYTNKSGDTVLEYFWFDDDNDPRATDGDYQVRYLDETPVLGDKVICAWIDNQILVEDANDVTRTVRSYSWRDDEITCTDDSKLGQSGIGNATDMMQNLASMEDNVEYTMYLDHFGYVRAYEPTAGITYALITEAYARNNANGNILQDWPMNVELTIKDADTKEYNLVGGRNNLFVSEYSWAQIRNYSAVGNYYNWLQPATSHMGVGHNDYDPVYGVPTFGTDTWSYWWDWDQQIVHEIDGLVKNDTFDYGANTESEHTVSFTNVAITSIDGENATLKGASQLKYNQDGSIARYPDTNRVRYAVDYIQLDTTLPVAAGAVRYPIGGDSAYIANNNYYVNAVHDTEYYIVYDGGVEYFTDFAKLPKLEASKVGSIHAAYAVAKDISSDNDGQPYWVADVIVFEVEEWDNAKTSVSLAYYTPSRTSGDVQQLNILHTSNGLVNLIPGGKSWSADRGQWGRDWDGYGFYHLYDETAPVDGTMTAPRISRITNSGNPANGNYGKNNIYAGVVVREAYLAGNSYYIDVDMGWQPWMGARATGTDTIASIDIGTVDTGKIYSITTDDTHQGYWYDYNEATQLRYKNTNSTQIKAGDRVIWVNKDAVKTTDRVLNTTQFVVDLGNPETNRDIWSKTASFLASSYGSVNDEVFTNPNPAAGEWIEIMKEQNYVAPGEDTVTVDTAGAVELVNDAYDTAVAAVEASTLTAEEKADKLAELETLRDNALAAIAAASVAENNEESIAAAEQAVADAADVGVANIEDAVAGLEPAEDPDVTAAKEQVKDAKVAVEDAIADAVDAGYMTQDEADDLLAELGAIDPGEINEDNLDDMLEELLAAVKDIEDRIPTAPIGDSISVTAIYKIDRYENADTWTESYPITETETSKTIFIPLEDVQKWPTANSYTLKVGEDTIDPDTEGYTIDVSAVTDGTLTINVEVAVTGIPLVPVDQQAGRIHSARVLGENGVDQLAGTFVLPVGVKPAEENSIIIPKPEELIIDWENAWKIQTIGTGLIVWGVNATIPTATRLALIQSGVAAIIVLPGTTPDDTPDLPTEYTLTITDEGKIIEAVTVTRGEETLTNPAKVQEGDKIVVTLKAGKRGTVTINGTEVSEFTVGTEDVEIIAEDNAPEVTENVVIGVSSGAAVDTADCTLVQNNRDYTVANGAIIWTYKYTLTILDADAYEFVPDLVTSNVGSTMVENVKDASGNATAVTNITLSNVPSTAKPVLTVVLTPVAEVKTAEVTVSDPNLVTVSETTKTVIVGKETTQTVTLTLNEVNAVGMIMPENPTQIIPVDAKNMDGAALKFGTVWTAERSTDKKSIAITFDKATLPATAAKIRIEVTPTVETGTDIFDVEVKTSGTLPDAATTGLTVSPAIAIKGSNYSDLKLKLVATGAYALPAKDDVTVGYYSNTNEFTPFEDTDYTYDENTGDIKIIKADTVKSDIRIVVAAAPTAITKLTVSFDKGEWSVKDGTSNVLKNGVKATVVYGASDGKEADAIYGTIDTVISGLIGSRPASTGKAFANYPFVAGDTGPSLYSTDNNNAYLVVIVESAGNITKIGYEKVTGVTTPKPVNPPASSEDAVVYDNGAATTASTKVIATRKNYPSYVEITLTAADGYFLTDNVDNVVDDVKAGTAWGSGTPIAAAGYSVELGMTGTGSSAKPDRKTATVLIMNSVADKVFIELGANATVGKVAAIDNIVVEGTAIKTRGAGNTTTDITGGKFVLVSNGMDVDAVNAKIAAQPSDMSVEDFLTEIGFKTTTTKSCADGYDDSAKKDGDTNTHIIVMEVNATKVIKAGAFANPLTKRTGADADAVNKAEAHAKAALAAIAEGYFGVADADVDDTYIAYTEKFAVAETVKEMYALLAEGVIAMSKEVTAASITVTDVTLGVNRVPEATHDPLYFDEVKAIGDTTAKVLKVEDADKSEEAALVYIVVGTPAKTYNMADAQKLDVENAERKALEAWGNGTLEGVFGARTDNFAFIPLTFMYGADATDYAFWAINARAPQDSLRTYVGAANLFGAGTNGAWTLDTTAVYFE